MTIDQQLADMGHRRATNDEPGETVFVWADPRDEYRSPVWATSPTILAAERSRVELGIVLARMTAAITKDPAMKASLLTAADKLEAIR